MASIADAGKWHNGPSPRNSSVITTTLYRADRYAIASCFDSRQDGLPWCMTIDDADAALSGSVEERETLFRALNDTVKFWAGKPELPGQEKTTDHERLAGTGVAGHPRALRT
ncbi:hypothetical protein [Streptomyces cahuitamycinicus]|uniref:hypothetical protein n=1 Tax=Streptomyces cahuitamycinicus TaxID=2070367 RepID=UPI0015E11144|nr:hypothetical protein [Streptomyces cahuitamycinicus]